MRPRARSGRHASGMTLTELIIVSSLMGLAMIVVSPLLKNIHQGSVKAVAQITLQQELRLVTRRIEQAFNKNSASPILSQKAGQPPRSWLKLSTTELYQDRNRLVLVLNGSTTVLSERLRQIAFVRFGTATEVNLTLQEPSPTGDFQLLRTKFALYYLR